MSTNNSDGAVMPYSEQAYNRGVVIGAEPKPSTPPSASHVEAITPNRVEGADIGTSHGAGVMRTVTDPTGEIILNRDPKPTDLVTITLSSGAPMTLPIRVAVREGFLMQDASGKFHEADRAAQQAAVDAIRKAEIDKANSEALKFSDPVEQGIHEVSEAMKANGLDFGNELATFIGSDGNTVSDPASKFAQANGFEMTQQLQAYMGHMKAAVTQEVLAPQGIEPEAFLQWIQESGLHRGKANKAALAAFHLRTLDGFKSLAAEFLNTGGRYRQRRG